MKSVRIAMPHCGNRPFRVYMTGKYIASLRRAGAKVLRIRMDDPKLEEKVCACDGLLLPGGGDIEPSRYGQAPAEKCGKPNLLRDEAEWRLLTAFFPTGKPILGICRGVQVLNVFFGGTLYQDIPNHSAFKLRSRGSHNIVPVPGTKVASILGRSPVFVNSMHHQAADQIPPCLTVSARSEDGTVEALEHKEHPFCVGLQWHPEHLSAARADQQAIFHTFIEYCKNP